MTFEPLTPISIPSRFSQASFERYAPAIAAALTLFPKCLVLDPGDYSLSIETLSCRFRDALAAKLRYGYTYERINEYEFANKATHLVVGMHAGRVFIGSRAEVRLATRSDANQAPAINKLSTLPDTDEIEVSSNPIFLRMLCDMTAQKSFTPQPRFFVRNVAREEIEKLNRDYDVSVVEDEVEKGKFYIL